MFLVIVQQISRSHKVQVSDQCKNCNNGGTGRSADDMTCNNSYTTDEALYTSRETQQHRSFKLSIYSTSCPRRPSRSAEPSLLRGEREPLSGERRRDVSSFSSSQSVPFCGAISRVTTPDCRNRRREQAPTAVWAKYECEPTARTVVAICLNNRSQLDGFQN
jgi:hypothetical protein